MKRFATDHYFQIGSVHYQLGKPCQDYALSGGNSEAAVAIVSDGCSTGRHTDVGSRIQALSLLGAVRHVRQFRKTELSGMPSAVREERERLLRTAENLLGLSPQDMLATCAYCYLSPAGGFVHIEGDGVVARKFSSDYLVVSRYEWLGNMPFYPSYTGLDLATFVAKQGGNPDGHRLYRTTAVLDPEGSVVSEEVTEFTLHEGLSGIIEPVTPEDLEHLDFVAVFTDGVTQIEGIDWRTAVFRLMSFKSLEGEFAKRRMIRELKDCVRGGSKPLDDTSMAVIRIHNVPEEPKEQE